MAYRVGIDIGGTFTDFVLFDGEQLILEKVLSTPADNSEAVITGLKRLAEQRRISFPEFLSQIDTIVHGTTVADNALIEGKGATVGLLTTSGFRDEIELRRGYKEDIWDVRLEPPKQIVPRRRRVTVPERIAADGTVVTPLDEDAARNAIRRLKKQGVDSVAIVTLFSFVNPVHEERLAQLVAEELPEAALSVSHRIMPKAPEFERTSTTVVNAFVSPRVTSYLDKLVSRLREAGYRNELLVMQSSGGVMTRDFVRSKPVVVLASGPAGGVMAGVNIGKRKKAPDLLCVDMGGTSYDVSVVLNGVAPAETGWNWHHRYLVGLPMVSVVTLGAGGGSVAGVRGGMLQVGPDSVGADPGPVCYGRGGSVPTVTDANLVLGLLSPEAEFAGGSFRLTREGVDEAFATHVAEPVGKSVEEAAFDVWRLVNANMSQSVRRVTADKGIDPRKLTMLAYGGNGPVHAGIQAQDLGIERILVPRSSPAFSALGVLSADPLIDEERSCLSPVSTADVERLRALWDELSEAATGHFRDARLDQSQITYHYHLNLRYSGQNWSLSVPVTSLQGRPDTGFADQARLLRVVEEFHSLHEEEYSYARRGEEPEITGVRLITTSPGPKPAFGEGTVQETGPAPVVRTRRANLGDGFAEVPIFRGPELEQGMVISGPAIIEESFTTIVVYPGWKAALDDAHDYVLMRT